MRPAPALLCLLLATGADAVSLQAQKQADQARLAFTISVGQNSGGGTLWTVGKQPFLTDVAGTNVTDTLRISRLFRRSLSVQFAGSYFPGEHIGFTAEALLVGLGTSDVCSMVAYSGSVETSELCSTIQGSERSATATALSGGLIYRGWVKNPVHPYLRAGAGFVLTQQSTLKTTGLVPGDSTLGFPDADLILYDDGKPQRLHPYLNFGAGLVAAAGRGYQFRVELRDNYTRLPAVAVPTQRQGLRPRDKTVGRHTLSLLIGFDVVLERKRGRRY